MDANNVYWIEKELAKEKINCKKSSVIYICSYLFRTYLGRERNLPMNNCVKNEEIWGMGEHLNVI